MSKHTPEPWFHHKPSGSQHTSGGYINNSASRNIDAICHVYGGDTGLADAGRIVACVNACAGMENPAAEITELKRQRDDLLAALNDAATSLETIQLRSFGEESCLDSKPEMRSYAGSRAGISRDVIAKIKGGAA